MSNLENKEPRIPIFHLIIKIAVSVSAGIAWLIFLIVWLYFVAARFSVYQNLAIFLLSILVLGIVNSIAWIPFGILRRR